MRGVEGYVALLEEAVHLRHLLLDLRVEGVDVGEEPWGPVLEDVAVVVVVAQVSKLVTVSGMVSWTSPVCAKLAMPGVVRSTMRLVSCSISPQWA